MINTSKTENYKPKLKA